MVFPGDHALLEAFRNSEADVLERIYCFYANDVERFVRHAIHRFSGGRTHLPFDVQDVVQDVFVRAFDRGARLAYDDTRPYGAYLRTIARNEVIGRLRKSGREVLVDTAELEFSAAEDPPDEEVADPVVMAKVALYLATLPPDLRAVHQARYGEDLPQQEAASLLGLSRQQLRTLEGRLRQGLVNALAQGRAPSSSNAFKVTVGKRS